MVCFGLGLSGFGLKFGDGGVVFGLGVIFQNDFLRCPKADDHVFDGGNVWKFSGEGYVDGALVAEAVYTAEILLKVRSAGICGSDIGAYKGVNPLVIILGLFALGIIGYAVGLFA